MASCAKTAQIFLQRGFTEKEKSPYDRYAPWSSDRMLLQLTRQVKITGVWSEKLQEENQILPHFKYFFPKIKIKIKNQKPKSKRKSISSSSSYWINSNIYGWAPHVLEISVHTPPQTLCPTTRVPHTFELRTFQT